ncbi:hypothetical protein [Niabella beijingensis]|uniref:hypothetical protein n=1 Tax=Niabella beijingensis TaxID=2872700 RepID=UPI001CBF16D0|nr:hypothetical protein [Niabella beijingensis]MBZ4191988.1 hypothetical protein [Niabella beijingensis]
MKWQQKAVVAAPGNMDLKITCENAKRSTTRACKTIVPCKHKKIAAGTLMLFVFYLASYQRQFLATQVEV